MRSLFEQMGGTYRWEGDYHIPNFELPPASDYQLGKYGRMRRSYLKEHIESVITDEQVYSNDRSKLWHRPNDMPDSMDIRRYTALYQELYFPIKKNL